MKSKSRLCNRKGSLVVEAALVFPIVFLAVIAVIYICMLMYQRTYIQTLANLAADRGAATWNNFTRDTTLGRTDKVNLDASGLYWRLFDFNKTTKEHNLKDYIEKRLGAYSILGSDKQVSIQVVDYIAYKKLVISINDSYRIPVGSVLKIFGLGDRYTISVKSEAVINEPVEFIRNTDFVLDMEREFEDKYPGYGRLVHKIRDTMSSLKDKIVNSKFLDTGEGDGAAK